jgi:hypothetical protein
MAQDRTHYNDGQGGVMVCRPNVGYLTGRVRSTTDRALVTCKRCRQISGLDRAPMATQAETARGLRELGVDIPNVVGGLSSFLESMDRKGGR